MRLFLAIILLVATPLYANQLLRERTTSLMHTANNLAYRHGYTRYINIPKHINVFEVDHNTIHQLFCKAKCKNIPYALTINNTIYLGPEVKTSTPYGESILFHESVHLLQFYNLGPNKGCHDWYAREIEAYTLQQLYINSIQYNSNEPELIVYQLQAFKDKCNEPHKE